MASIFSGFFNNSALTSTLIPSISSSFPGLFNELASDGRALTPGEIEMSKKYFDDSIDYTQVRLKNADSVVDAGSSFFRARAKTLDNTIFLSATQYRDDFSYIADGDNRKTFMHEMTHIYQQQQGQSALWQAAKGWLSSGFNYKKSYEYEMTPGAKFSDFNAEQQAHIVARHYELDSRLKRPFLWPLDQEEWEKEMKDLEKILGSEFKSFAAGIDPKPQPVKLTTNMGLLPLNF